VTVGQRDHRVDSELAVAEHARVRGAALRVTAEEWTHHPGPELVLKVERQVRDAERVGDSAGAEHGLGRAAAALTVGLLIGPELEGDGNHVPPGLALAERRDRRVDAATEGDEHALAIIRPLREPRARPSQRGERAMEGIGRQHRGVTVAGGEPAELGLDLIGADPGGLQHRRSIRQLRDRGGCCRACGTALAIEADALDPAVENQQ
jgi:hypothetical protein